MMIPLPIKKIKVDYYTDAITKTDIKILETFESEENKIISN